MVRLSSGTTSLLKEKDSVSDGNGNSLAALKFDAHLFIPFIAVSLWRIEEVVANPEIP